MSWQEMIENLQTVALPDGTQLGMLSACAICDLQGNLWGQSEGFPGIATDEAQKLMELFADPFSHCANGIYIGGTKVYYVSYLFFFASSSSSSGSTSVVFLFLNFSQKKKYSQKLVLFYKTVRLFKRFGRRRRGRSREERHGVRFSREEVQNMLRYWYSRKQPGDATVLGARGGVRRISRRARHVVEERKTSFMKYTDKKKVLILTRY